MMGEETQMRSRLRGLILGTAVGDGLGLPGEGFGREKIAALGWTEWEHRFVFGRGMVSDDTEHTLFVAQSLIAFSDDSLLFQKSLAWKLRLWLLGLPAGIGYATLRSILRLWFGYSPSKSGVWSAGNGPAMRSAVIGVQFCNDQKKMLEFVKASTLLTHSDPRAETGAAAIALCAAKSVKGIKPEGKRFGMIFEGLG